MGPDIVSNKKMLQACLCAALLDVILKLRSAHNLASSFAQKRNEVGDLKKRIASLMEVNSDHWLQLSRYQVNFFFVVFRVVFFLGFYLDSII